MPASQSQLIKPANGDVDFAVVDFLKLFHHLVAPVRRWRRSRPLRDQQRFETTPISPFRGTLLSPARISRPPWYRQTSWDSAAIPEAIPGSNARHLAGPTAPPPSPGLCPQAPPSPHSSHTPVPRPHYVP